MEPTPLLDLVAVAYEARCETGAFLASLIHVDVPYTLTIIDNASPDAGVREVIKRALPAAHGNCLSSTFVFNDQNIGYARAVNQGMATQGEPAPYAAILNADVEFLPSESIRDLIKEFERDDEIGVMGPRTIDNNNRITHGGIVTTEWNPRNHHRGWLHPDHPQFRDTLTVNTVSGATYFVRRSMWDELTKCPLYQRAAPEAIGAFLPTKHFYEETFCSYHARSHGWKVIYQGSVCMMHKWHRSSPVGSQDIAGPRVQFVNACELHAIDMAGEL